MLNRSQTTTFLQIFYELLLYSQVILKSMRAADDTSEGISECEWVKQFQVKQAKKAPDNQGAHLPSSISCDICSSFSFSICSISTLLPHLSMTNENQHNIIIEY